MSSYAPPADAPVGSPPIGIQRHIGKQIFLSIVTLGVYGLYWAYVSHEDIRQQSGSGVGGLVGVLLMMFAFPVSLFLLPIEIQRMYEDDGQESPVRASTAAWILLFGIPWYVKCQKALNQFWASKGAPAARLNRPVAIPRSARHPGGRFGASFPQCRDRP